MSAPKISHASSLAVIWDELVYTQARLLADENAKDLAPAFEKLIARCDAVESGQRACWRQEIIVQADVDAADDGLDDVVADAERTLDHVVKGDHDDPRYRLYVKGGVSDIIRLGLQSEIERVRPWVKSLGEEPEKDFKAHAKELATRVKDGETALEARSSAAAETAKHRAREIDRFVDDVDAARLSAHAALVQRSVKLKLARTWADRFFRHATRAKRVAAPATPVAAAPAK
jgi:hypothetical protein